MNVKNPTPDDHDKVIEKALRVVQKEKPLESAQHQAAFANSVGTLVTGWSGGYGGPSVREHAAIQLYGDRSYEFEEAVRLLLAEDGPVFGLLTQLHQFCWLDECCFDDDPTDVAKLISLTGWAQPLF